MNVLELDICIDLEVAFNVTSIVDDEALCGTKPAIMKLLGSNDSQGSDGRYEAVISTSDLLRR
jgi:hypothetical protein